MNSVILEKGHINVKPYKCNFCERTFPESSKLTMHNRSHTGEKTFKCNLCEKALLIKLIRDHSYIT